ncbi:nucleotide-diphospho-sugar transferase [Baffinella frigidus]|nr:nucleotide-diphospho-sugar transferase [Cryptophyta sp. CCMP2293]
MEFQVVILAGGTGTRLYPLTEHTTKSLLPVANRPLVSYQLALLERSGFKEALVATTPAAKEAMDFFLSNDYKGDVQVEVCVVDEDMETADVLRCLKDKITRDFVVVSGDLITDVFLHHLADVHRIHDATCTVLLRAPKPVNLPTGHTHLRGYPETRNPKPETRNPRSETRNPKPEIRDPKPETRNPKFKSCSACRRP